MSEQYHEPVMLQESIEGLNINPNGTYVDCTYGGGGHAKAILERLDKGKLIAFDQDEDAKKNLINDNRLIFINYNFRHIERFLKLNEALPVDGILADLGISSHQINEPERGFSTRFDEELLDMRMDKAGATAADILNNYSDNQLYFLLRNYGEVKNARPVVSAIIAERKMQPVQTAGQLKEILKRFVPAKKQNKFFAQVFQALRIEVNHELEALKDLLVQSVNCLKTGSRVVVISYHSLEDRLVKNMVKRGNLEGEVKKDFYGNILKPFNEITKRPLVPSEEEIKRNPRARSAKLRIAEKI